MLYRLALSLSCALVVVTVACGDSAYKDADVGDPCDGYRASCSVDGSKMLECGGDDVFVEANACADGCVTTANGLVSVGPDSVCCDNGDERDCLSLH